MECGIIVTNMVAKTRDTMMDALKGAAILLVVLGHSLQALPNFDDNLLFRVIYAFHMPLFMFVSGYVAFYGRDNQSWAQLRKKAAILVLPFVAWYGVSYIVTGAYLTTNLRHYVKVLILSPDHGLWFLWVLFVNFLLLALALRLEQRLKAWVFPLIWLALQILPIDTLGLSLVRWHFGFFAIGFLIHRYRNLWLPYRKQLATVGLIGFPLLVQFWRRVDNPDFAAAVAGTFDHRHLHQIDLLILETYKYAVPMLGIIAAWAIVGLASRYLPSIHRSLGWIGLYTLDIYVTHQYLVKYGVGVGPLRVVTGFAIALAGSLIISFLLLRRNKLLAMVFLGKAYPKRDKAKEPTLVPLPAKPLAS
jgi:fucose 4-O-acetylase-like acetyltransferase